MQRCTDVDKINEILHFAKAIGSFHKYFGEYVTKSWKNWPPFSGRMKVSPHAYLADIKVTNFLYWLSKYILMCRFLDVRRYYADELNLLCQQLHDPKTVTTVDAFSTKLGKLESTMQFVDKEVTAKISYLTCSESIRLDEALVCFQNYSFYASVIMAVSAVEGRIMELIQRKNKGLYNSTFNKFTLGQLIQVFEPGKYADKKYARIKKLMPDKHRPLIALLNQYRVFSAHPTEEQITAQIAESILHLAFAFMLDESICPYSEEEREHASRPNHPLAR